jgi:hypothetical protein
MKAHNPKGLKIPVSAVRFRVWAHVNPAVPAPASVAPSTRSTPGNAGRVPAGCQPPRTWTERHPRLYLTLLCLWYAVAPSCALGCAAPSADWYGDARFSADERAAIENGEVWLAAHAGRAPATFEWGLEVSEQPLAHTIRRERSPRATTGLCLDGTVYLDPDDRNATPGSLEGLAAHELAHCELGFADDPESAGLMHVVWPLAWTEREQAQLK